jgi:hypothetical protein
VAGVGVGSGAGVHAAGGRGISVGEHEPAAGGGDGDEPAKPELETRDGWTLTKGEWARLDDDEFDGPESMSALLASCQQVQAAAGLAAAVLAHHAEHHAGPGPLVR